MHLLANLVTISRWSVEKTMTAAVPFLLLLALYALLMGEDIGLLATLFAVVAPRVCRAINRSRHSRVGERYYYEVLFAIAIVAARGTIRLQINGALP